MFAKPWQSVTQAYEHEARETLKDAHATIVHCLNQLNDEQVNWRPFEEQKSLARTHGGAVAHGVMYELPLRYRAGRREDEKRRIANKAASRVSRWC